MSWANPIGDLRTLLSDGPTDKLRAFKGVFGNLNGTNTLFKTFEFRRTTDFTQSVAPFGIYLNGNLLASNQIASDDLATGYFTLRSAPNDSDEILTTYYIQWFLDTELDGFLVRASDWIGLGDIYANLDVGLKTAALKYAAHEAYQKLSLKYAENIVETFRMQDSPDEKRMDIVANYQMASRNALKDAQTYRDDFYKNRKGMALAPIVKTIRGNVKNPTLG